MTQHLIEAFCKLNKCYFEPGRKQKGSHHAVNDHITPQTAKNKVLQFLFLFFLSHRYCSNDRTQQINKVY